MPPSGPSGPRQRGTPPRAETPLSRSARYVWIGRLGAACLWLWGKSWRVEWDSPASVREIEEQGEHVIYAFWHQHIIPLSYAFRGRKVVVMVSTHGDGEIISQVIHRLGFGTVRGSTTRGGIRAALELARAGRAGYPLSITPDGPRGPRQRCQPGIVLVAQRTGLPIVPVAAGMRRVRRLDSWDRFELPSLGTRLLVTTGEPILVPAELSLDAATAEWVPRVQAALEQTEARAQAWEAGRADWREVRSTSDTSETSYEPRPGGSSA